MESGHSFNDVLFTSCLSKCEVVFCTPNKTVLNILQRLGITFDVAVFDGAGRVNEFETWWTTFPLV